MGPNGSLYESGLLHHSTVKPMSPSHQSNTRVGISAARHLVELSSGSTCCSSSSSSSPHTLMQSAPPVPSLPQSLAQGVMLFTPAELTTAGDSLPSGSPSHYAGHQYSSHPYHPYLNSHNSSTLPRHYDANAMSLSTASPLKLFAQDQIVVCHFNWRVKEPDYYLIDCLHAQHTSAIYEDQYTPVIVNSLDASYQHHLSSVHQQSPPILYYNSASPMPPMLDGGVDSKVHYHQPHLKSSGTGNSSQTLPRRCSVGPLEGPQANLDGGLYVSFTKAPKSGLLAQTKNYTGSGLQLKSAAQPQHVDCVEGVENLPLLSGVIESTNSASGDQANLTSSLRPHEICLVSVC